MVRVVSDRFEFDNDRIIFFSSDSSILKIWIDPNWHLQMFQIFSMEIFIDMNEKDIWYIEIRISNDKI
jgi:hypothetical protein